MNLGIIFIVVNMYSNLNRNNYEVEESSNNTILYP